MGNKKDPIISAFKKNVKDKIGDCKIILFGSRAKKTFKKESDYDFLLISSKFSKWEWEERGAKVYRLKRDIPAAMDIICLTPEEFEIKKNSLGIIREAAKEGLVV